jgi:hypothetical protein
VEARLVSVTERRVLAASQTSVSRVLASLCWFADFPWSRVSDFDGLPTPANHRVSRSHFGSTGVQSKTASWIWPFPARNCRGKRSPAGEVCVEVKSHHVRSNRAAGCLFALEYVAASRQIEPGSNLPRLPYRKILRKYSGEHHDYKKEN